LEFDLLKEDAAAKTSQSRFSAVVRYGKEVSDDGNANGMSYLRNELGRWVRFCKNEEESAAWKGGRQAKVPAPPGQTL
jgi:hypothetical protein